MSAQSHSLSQAAQQQQAQINCNALRHDTLLTIQAMKSQEPRYRITSDYMHSVESSLLPQDADASSSAGQYVDPECRLVLCGWAYRVVDHFDIGREVVAYAMSYVDRFCSNTTATMKSQSLTRDAYKLVMTTALYLALKLHHEGERETETQEQEQDLSSQSLATILPYLTRGTHTQAHLDKFETVLLQSLGFYVHPPLVTCYVEQYVTLLRPLIDQDLTQLLLKEANVFVQLSVLEYSLVVSVSPSLIALAALLNALGIIANNDHKMLETYTQKIQSSLITGLDQVLNINTKYVEELQANLWEAHVVQFGARDNHTEEDKPEEVLPRLSPTSTTQFTYSATQPQ